MLECGREGRKKTNLKPGILYLRIRIGGRTNTFRKKKRDTKPLNIEKPPTHTFITSRGDPGSWVSAQLKEKIQHKSPPTHMPPAHLQYLFPDPQCLFPSPQSTPFTQMHWKDPTSTTSPVLPPGSRLPFQGLEHQHCFLQEKPLWGSRSSTTIMLWWKKLLLNPNWRS